MLLGTCSRAVVRCVLCAPSGSAAPGGHCCLAPVRVPWLWPAACLSGVPRGPAWCAAPRPVWSLSVLRSAFPTPWCLSPSRRLPPPALLGGCAGYAEAGREPGSLCPPLATAEAGDWARSASYPFGAPRRGCPWRVAPASVLGCVRCGGWRVRTQSLTRPVSRAVCRSTGDSVGAPGLFRVDANTSPCKSEDATPGSRACLHVLVLPGRVGQAGLPGAFWCASPFPLAALSFCFARPPPGCGCPFPVPLFASFFFFFLVVLFPMCASVVSCSVWFLAPCALGLGALFFFQSPSPRFVFFFLSSRPLCALVVSGFLWFPAQGALGLRAVCCLFRWSAASRLCLRSRCSCVSCLAVRCSLVVAAPIAPPPPSPFCVSRILSLPLGAPPPFFLPAPLMPVGYALVGGSRRLPPPPLLLFVMLVSCCSALRLLLLVLCFHPWWLLPRPPPFCVSWFSWLPRGAPFFFPLLLCSCQPAWRSLAFLAVCCPPPPLLLFVLLVSRCSALRVLSLLLCFPPGRCLLPGGCCPPPPPFCVSRFSSLPLGAPLFFVAFSLLCCRDYPSQSLPGSKITAGLRLVDASNAENEQIVDSHQNHCQRRRPYSSKNTLMVERLRGRMYSHRMLPQSLKNSDHQQGPRMVTKPKQLNPPKQPRRH